VLTQLLNPPGVIEVVMSDQNACQLQIVFKQCLLNDIGIARINNKRFPRMLAMK
jgi:hypothetical protein